MECDHVSRILLLPPCDGVSVRDRGKLEAETLLWSATVLLVEQEILRTSLNKEKSSKATDLWETLAHS